MHRTCADYDAHMDDVTPDPDQPQLEIDQIDARLNALEWSRGNRISLGICLLVGLAISADLIRVLIMGEYFQYIRHSIGPLLVLMWCVLMVKSVREAGTLFARLAELMLESDASAGLSAERKSRVRSSLRLRELGLRHFILGGANARKLLARQLGAALRE